MFMFLFHMWTHVIVSIIDAIVSKCIVDVDDEKRRSYLGLDSFQISQISLENAIDMNESIFGSWNERHNVNTFQKGQTLYRNRFC